MTVELVTGHAGTGHIDGADVGGLIAGVAGSGDYVLEEPYGTISCTVQDNNHVQIGKGDLIMNGRHVRIEDPETLTVQSGTQRQERHDLVVMHYSRQSSGIEDAELQVLRGTPGSSGTPGYGTDTILDGATTRDMPLYRLDLDGISLSTSPVRLFSTLKPVSELPSLRDSVTRTTTIDWSVPYGGGHIQLERCGLFVSVHGNVKFTQSGDFNYSHNNERIPVGYRPVHDNTTIIFTHTGGGDGYTIIVAPDGSTTSLGNPRSAYSPCTGSWLTADPWPSD